MRVGDDRLPRRRRHPRDRLVQPHAAGLEIGGRILTSEQALELDEIPGSVVILGGGVIGVEFASVWRSFGADVTIVEALDHLVPNEDVALSKGLERAFRRRGIAVLPRRALPDARRRPRMPSP